jgi:hypothetical protein
MLRGNDTKIGQICGKWGKYRKILLTGGKKCFWHLQHVFL